MKIYTSIPQSVILSAVTKLEDFIKPTYGASGKGILIDNGFNPSIDDDGFSAAEAFELEDELENAVISYIKGASRKTFERAGDGTTTAILLMCALIRSSLNTTAIGEVDYKEIVDNIKAGLVIAQKEIKKTAKKISTVEDLEKIALNAFNNKEIAKIVAKTVFDVGVDGVVTLEESTTYETTSKVVLGMTIDRGFISPTMATNDGETILNKPRVIITDEIISLRSQLELTIAEITKTGCKDILIIADSVEGEALNSLIINRVQYGLNCIVVKCPSFGDQRVPVLEDIAISTGSNVLSARVARPISTITVNDCGFADKIIISKDETIIIGGKSDKKLVKERIDLLNKQIKEATPIDKVKIKDRIAKLSGGIGIISIGVSTDEEMRAIRKKTNNAIRATQLAFKEGVVLGGGELLASLKTGCRGLNEALKSPRSVLEANGKRYITKGAQDACGVVLIALESAVSIASELIMCGGIITIKNDKKDN